MPYFHNDLTNQFVTFLSDALKDALRPNVSSFEEIFAEGVTFEFPYAPDDLPKRIEGTSLLKRYIEGFSGLVQIEQFTHPIVHRSTGETVVLEFSCKGKSLRNGARYDQDYVSVISVRNRQIVRYRDYWNPLIVQQAMN